MTHPQAISAVGAGQTGATLPKEAGEFTLAGPFGRS